MDMPLDKLIIIYVSLGVPFYILALIFMFGFIQFSKQKRRMARIETSSITKVRAGEVEVFGTVTPIRSFEVYGHSSQCVYHRINISEKVGKHWQTRFDQETYFPFYLEDEMGKILVIPDKAYQSFFELSQERTYIHQSTDLEKIQHYGVKIERFLGIPSTYQVQETFIEAGQPFYVLGTAFPTDRIDHCDSEFVIMPGTLNKITNVDTEAEEQSVDVTSFNHRLTFHQKGIKPAILGAKPEKDIQKAFSKKARNSLIAAVVCILIQNVGFLFFANIESVNQLVNVISATMEKIFP